MSAVAVCASLSVCLSVCAVGEPLNVDAWKWYYEVVGDKRCPIVDTWWQTGVWNAVW